MRQNARILLLLSRRAIFFSRRLTPQRQKIGSRTFVQPFVRRRLSASLDQNHAFLGCARAEPRPFFFSSLSSSAQALLYTVSSTGPFQEIATPLRPD